MQTFVVFGKICFYQGNMQMYAKNLLFNVVFKKNISPVIYLFINEQMKRKLRNIFDKK